MAQGDLLCPQESAVMKFQDVQDLACDGGQLKLLVAAHKLFCICVEFHVV